MTLMEWEGAGVNWGEGIFFGRKEGCSATLHVEDGKTDETD
jgi:hypothetical protein